MWRLAHTVAAHHGTIAVLVFALAWASAAAVFAANRFAFDNYGALELLVESDPAVDEMDMANSALAAVDAPPARERYRERTVPAPTDVGSLLHIFRPTDPSAPVYTASSLQAMCRLENVARKLPDFDDVCIDNVHLPVLSSRSAASTRFCATSLTSPTAYFYVDWKVALPLVAGIGWLRNVSAAVHILDPPLGNVTRAELLRMEPVYEPSRHTRRCALLSEHYVRERETQLLRLLVHAQASTGRGDNCAPNAHSLLSPRVASDLSSALGLLVDRGACQRGYATQAAALVTFGAPLRGFSTPADHPAAQLKRFMDFERHYAQAYADAVKLAPPHPLGSRWRGRAILLSNGSSGGHRSGAGLEALFLGSMNLRMSEVTQMAYHSLFYTIGSMTLVCAILIVQLGSCTLALFALWQILAAIPIAWLIYALLVPITAAISTLAFFVLIGIGADDIFIFHSAWLRSRGASLSDAERLHATLRATGGTLVTTSLTTALGFGSLAACPLPVLASLGVFASISILVDLALTLTLWPSLLLLWEHHLRTRERRLALASRFISTTLRGVTVEIRDAEQPKSPQRELARLLKQEPVASSQAALMPRAMSGAFETFGMALRSRSLAWALVLSAGSLVLLFGWRGLQLRFPPGRELLLPPEHMFTRAAAAFEQQGGDPVTATQARGAVFFGLLGIDRSADSRFRFDSDRGRLVWDDSFRIQQPPVQLALLQVSQAMRRAQCKLPGCSRSALISPESPRIFLEEWAEQRAMLAGVRLGRQGGCNSEVKAPLPSPSLRLMLEWLPPAANFSGELSEWLLTANGARHREQLGYVGGTVRFVKLPFISTSATYSSSHSHWNSLRAIWRALFERELAAAPASLRQHTFALVYAQEQVNPTTGERLLASLFAISRAYSPLAEALVANLGVTLGICCMVVAIATRSARLALFATLTVLAIVAICFGALEMCGFTMGIKEMCGAAAVVGFAFDYSLHLANAYAMTDGDRAERVRVAAATMGGPMLAGSLTTVCSVACILLSDFPFLLGVCYLVCLCAVASSVLSLVFFLPLVRLAGPAYA